MATAFADVIVIHKTNKNGKKMKSLKMASNRRHHRKNSLCPFYVPHFFALRFKALKFWLPVYFRALKL